MPPSTKMQHPPAKDPSNSRHQKPTQKVTDEGESIPLSFPAFMSAWTFTLIANEHQERERDKENKKNEAAQWSDAHKQKKLIAQKKSDNHQRALQNKNKGMYHAWCPQ
jgi:hypothetical protein